MTDPSPNNEAVVHVRSGPLVGAVLGRVVGMLAARAQCPIDRLDDAILLTDAVAAHAPVHARNSHVHVVVHAYPDGEGPMGLRASIDERRLSLVVTDRGRGIVPRPDSPGLGLGLPLIATLAESLELGTGRLDETEVRMTFDLGAPVSGDGVLA